MVVGVDVYLIASVVVLKVVVTGGSVCVVVWIGSAVVVVSMFSVFSGTSATLPITLTSLEDGGGGGS